MRGDSSSLQAWLADAAGNWRGAGGRLRDRIDRRLGAGHPLLGIAPTPQGHQRITTHVGPVEAWDEPLR